MSTIAERLRNPARQVDLDTLAREWFHQIISVRISGYGALARHERLLSKVRGALGGCLLESASPEAVSGKPCPWQPPCALDIFFREQLRLGRHGVPKPFVLAAEVDGRDLLIHLTVFGFACDWTTGLGQALVRALRDKVDWRTLGAGIFLPKIDICDVIVETLPGLKLGTAPSAISLDFETPVDTSGTDPLEKPSTLIARLARRIDGLARWQDAAIDVRWEERAAVWNGFDYKGTELENVTLERGSRRQGRRIKVEALSGHLEIRGQLRALWPLLVIGQTCHVGRGAVTGLGRYHLAGIL